MSQLHLDILLKIFDNWNDIASRSSLNDLRSASQVCITWRELLLTTPLLWAKLVNLDLLDQKTGHWRSEVLRRTGNVPLHIQCRQRRVALSPNFLPFFKNLLTDNWHRIQSLSVKLPYEFLIPGTILVQKLQKPAPVLQRLAIAFHPSTRVLQRRINQVVRLGDDAPFIRYLETPSLSIPLEAPWLSNLRTLCFSPELTSDELIQVLDSIPLLEQLDMTISRRLTEQAVISTPVREDEEEEKTIHGLHQIVELPFLDSIVIRTESLEWTRYLDVLVSIRASSGNSLTYNAKNWDILPTITDISDFSAFLQHQISDTKENGTHNRTLFASFTLRSFHLVTPALTVNLEFSAIQYKSHIKTLIESLSNDYEYWKFITDFTFRSEHDICPQGVADKKLANFLSFLTSVKILRISQLDILDMISQLTVVAPDDPIIFLELEVIEVSGITTSTLGTLLDFLNYRVGIERPIKILTLKRHIRALSANLEPLDQFHGLKITWWDGHEYICGSKNPSKLNFSAHPA